MDDQRPVAPHDLDWLDGQYLDRQDRIAAAIAANDSETAQRMWREGRELSVVDADHAAWEVLPKPSDPVPTRIEPDFRFQFRYLKDGAGSQKVIARRSRFASAPSLARTYADHIGGTGWLPMLVAHSEPVGYVAGATVGLGLWLMLADVVGSLPGIVVLLAMVVLAGGLWFGTVRMAELAFREAKRLSAILGAAAIGVTGAVPWVGTIETSMSDEARICIAAGVVTIASITSFWLSRSAFAFFTGIVACLVTFGTASFVLADAMSSGPDAEASAQAGVLVAVILLFPVTTRVAALRWVPPATIVIAAVGVVGTFAMDWDLASNLHILVVVALGLTAAASAWLSRTVMRRALRTYHYVAAAALTGAALLVLLSTLDWSFLEDVPLPVVLVTAGSIVLVAVAAALRLAVKRIGDRPPPT